VSRRDKLWKEIAVQYDAGLPTPEELQQRREFYERMAEFRALKPESDGPFPTTEEMIREDRDR
jgi:hypothetical protein